jgi:hypothetical protein
VNGVQVHRVGFDSLKEVAYYYSGATAGRGRVGSGVQRPGMISRFFALLYTHIWKKIYFPDDACLWYFSARKKVRTLLGQHNFDAILSVSLPFTGHLIGLHAKQHFPDVPWLADIGDPFTIQAKALNNSILYGRISRRLEKTILGKADAVVVTNNAAVKAYAAEFGTCTQKIMVIPPLLHPPILKNSKLVPPLVSIQDPEAIHIGYFGALYKPVRTPDALLNLLEQTFSARPDLKKRLHLHFFGDVFPEFYKKLRRLECIHLYGLRSRQEVRSAMQRMHILINIGNTTAHQLPSKAVEYLASEKPVLHLSYVWPDPFVNFWADAPGLLTIAARKDEIAAVDIQRWLVFLEQDRMAPSASRQLRVQDFKIESLAAAYFSLLFPKAALQSTAGMPVTPARR